MGKKKRYPRDIKIYTLPKQQHWEQNKRSCGVGTNVKRNALDYFEQAIGSAKDAARMAQLVDLYAKLPKGPAPVEKPSGLIGRYKARYFDGDNASAARMCSSIYGVSYGQGGDCVEEDIVWGIMGKNWKANDGCIALLHLAIFLVTVC